MATLLNVIIVVSGLIFVFTVMFMSPKWNWLWAISWMSIGGTNEYWSKKSIENTLKKTAIISWIIFTIVSLLYPFIK